MDWLYPVAAGLAVGVSLITLAVVSGKLKEARSDSEHTRERMENLLRQIEQHNQSSQEQRFANLREEVKSSILGIGQLQQGQLEEFGKRITQLSDKNEARLSEMRETVEVRIKHLQNDNHQQLEQMREMVDEQLSTKLQKRLDDSFTIVSERLEQVYKGLGEMQSLATGVGDLKKVLTNVKTRGTWGEYQLGQLLEQMLSPGQYIQNAAIPPNSKERVEFAVKMPGRGEEEFVLIPIDSKFPQEDYIRLVEASEAGEPEAIRLAAKQLENSIKTEAKRIRDKYVRPPYTTDFAIMYLPVEGLYAEVLRIPGMAEMLQRTYHIMPSGPTTLTALLNSLQMGFRTLAIEKRSNDVWNLLGAFKGEFATFSETLQKTKKKLQEASNTMDSMETRTRVINRKLKDVQELDVHTSPLLEGELDMEKFD